VVPREVSAAGQRSIDGVGLIERVDADSFCGHIFSKSSFYLLWKVFGGLRHLASICVKDG
jgi:hypothetical protein